MTPARLLIATALVLGAGACGEVRLTALDASFTVDRDRVDFAEVWLGSRSERTIRVTNASRLDQVLALAAPDGYEAPGSVFLPAGSTVVVAVAFSPREQRSYPGELVIASEGRQRSVPLEGVGRALLSCPPATSCRSFAFTPERGVCEAVDAPDGLGCQDACTTDGTCQRGECVGLARSCDDHDACTDDACGPGGCLHTALSCPPPDDPCQVAHCDPETGCGTAPAVDGTPCGRAGCVVADVCIGGACVERDVPEGAPCGPPSPCQGPGTCRDRVCVRTPGESLRAEWSVGSGGVAWAPLSGREQAAFDEEGNAYSFSRAPNGADVSLLWSVSASGNVQWQLPLALQQWDAPERVAVSGDLILVATWMGNVAALQRLTGAPLWDSPLGPIVQPMLSPGYAGAPNLKVLTFLPSSEGRVRVLVLASPYNWGSSHSGPALDAFVVELNASSGAPVRAVRVGDDVRVIHIWRSDRAIDVAPSVAANEQGDLFLAVLAPTRELLALDRNLVERWRRPGFEFVLAAVDGNVVAVTEHSWEVVVVDSQSGMATANLGARVPAFVASTLVASSDAVEFEDLPGDGSRTDVGWTRWSLADGTRQWRVSLGKDARVHTALRTEEGTTLLVVSGPPTWRTELVEISPRGDLNFRCPGPAGPPTGVGLHDGTWIEFHDGTAPRLSGYSILPRSPATEGWIAPRGELGGTRATAGSR